MGHHRTRLAIGGGVVVAVALLGFVGAGLEPKFRGNEQPAGDAPAADKSIADVVAQASRSIARVSWVRELTVKNAAGKDTLQFDWQYGTGFVIRCVQSGGDDTAVNVEFDVVTNNHVLAMTNMNWTGPARYFCLMHGVTTTSLKLLGTDTLADLAVLRVQGTSPKERVPLALTWADPKKIRVGDKAIAIGYARDLEGPPSVTQGIIGAKKRSEPTTGSPQGVFADLLQTDAAVNHGNSGGPLLNLRGEVMGVNTYLIPPAVTKDATGNVTVDTTVGIYFARSSATARPFVEQLVKKGKVDRANLGVFSEITVIEPFKQYYNWPLGARITNVPAKSIADNLGLRNGDIIVAVGSAAQRPDSPNTSQETKIATTGEFNDQLGLRAADGSLWIRVVRPSDAWLTAIAAGQLPQFTGGTTQVFYLK